MLIKEIKDKSTWSNFIITNGEYSAFLHSWQWGEFQESLGRKIWRLGVFENEKLEAVALVIKNKLPFGKSYLYIPRGPILHNTEPARNASHSESGKHITHNILDYLKNEAIFLRIDPIEKLQIENLKAREVPAVQPQHTLVLDLYKSADELFSEMHSKTRYNIRLAERKGVKIRFSSEREDLDKFLDLIKITSKRDRFIPHTEDYYKKMFEILGDEILRVIFAEYKGEILAANLVIFFDNTVTYLHGASGSTRRNLMAPHLLQWETIKKAKEQGFKNYDFWGIAPEGSIKEKAWAGVTRFKRGFGGREISYPGTFDIPFDNLWYNIYRLVKKVRN